MTEFKPGAKVIIKDTSGASISGICLNGQIGTIENPVYHQFPNASMGILGYLRVDFESSAIGLQNVREDLVFPFPISSETVSQTAQPEDSFIVTGKAQPKKEGWKPDKAKENIMDITRGVI